MTVKVYVEGGGDHNKALHTECRRGFPSSSEKPGWKVVCQESWRAAEADGVRFLSDAHGIAGPGNLPILLVDSEAPVVGNDPWVHVKLRPGDGRVRPNG